jgi:hypothetical protein
MGHMSLLTPDSDLFRSFAKHSEGIAVEDLMNGLFVITATQQ